MSEQTIGAFTYAYQMSKMAWSLNDNSFEGLFNSPKPPTKVTYKVKSRLMTKEEWNRAKKILKTLNVK